MKIENSVIFSMSALHPPVGVVKDCDRLTFVTRDCFNNQFQGTDLAPEGLDWDSVNPATGPVFVEGAMPGDVLAIHIEDIVVGDEGVMSAEPGFGVLGSLVEKSVMKKIPVKNGIAYFAEDIQIPCTPMIGVIGVAPAVGSVPCGEPDCHGGNMDNAKIVKGSTLYLPVYVEGALLSMGDVHACMGDGEIMVTGLEIPAEVTVTVKVIKGMTMENPMLEDQESWYTIASHRELEQAVFIAVKAMTELVAQNRGISFEEAGMLLSAAGNLQFCQVVDPKRTVRMELNKRYLPDLHI